MAEESEKESQDEVKKLKRKLEGWREILLPIHSVLVWEKPFYPGVLAGATTLIFLLIWYLDLSVLTTLSVIGLLGSLLDYSIPLVSGSIFDPNAWNGTQEKQFEEICKEVVGAKQLVFQAWNTMGQMKESKPKVYFASAIGALVLLAWIGNVFNNLLLTYFLVTLLILLPGMKSNGTVNNLFCQAMTIVHQKMGKSKTN